MVERVAIPKRVRFEVFKRDGFECQYCGAHPPAVILHIDHILAVANGGTNDIANLLTACEPCNSGKGARPLGDVVPESVVGKAEALREREEQIRGYQEVVQQRSQRLEEEVEQVCVVYEKFSPGWTPSDKARVSIRSFIEKLGVHEVSRAMEKAFCSGVRSGGEFRYFCGICWRTIRGD